jgi:hypothetical protein
VEAKDTIGVYSESMSTISKACSAEAYGVGVEEENFHGRRNRDHFCDVGLHCLEDVH